MQEEPLLSDLRDEDKGSLFELITSPQINFYNSSYAPDDWESFCAWFDAIGQDNSKRVFAIVISPEQNFAGSITVGNIHPVQKNAKISIVLANDAYAQDIDKEALSEAVDHCCHKLKLNRIYAHCLASNKREIQTYLSLGFQIEGTLRAHACFEGCFHDLKVLGLLLPASM